MVATQYSRGLWLGITTHCNTLQHTATHCNTLQHTATHCNTLQRTAALCYTLQHTAALCNTLQPTAALCNTLQHTAALCNTLQPTAALCNTLQHTVFGGKYRMHATWRIHTRNMTHPCAWQKAFYTCNMAVIAVCKLHVRRDAGICAICLIIDLSYCAYALSLTYPIAHMHIAHMSISHIAHMPASRRTCNLHTAITAMLHV